MKEFNINKKKMYKIALISLSAIIIVMGILSLIPGLNLSVEPLWHSMLKIGFGLFVLFATLRYPKKYKLALYLFGGLVILMGLAALVPGLSLSIEPEWYAILKVIIGVIITYIAVM